MVLLYDVLKPEITRLNRNWKVMPGNVGVRTSENKSRIPDLMILTENQCQEISSLDSAIIQSALQLVSGFYEVREFTNNQRIISPTFPDLILTPEQVFNH